MANQTSNAFERVCPRTALLQGPARWALISGVLAALLLVPLLAALVLVADLLSTRGQVNYDDAPVGELAGVLEQGPNENRGILPTVVRNHRFGSIYDAPLRRLYDGIPWLREDGRALMLLILFAAAMGFLRNMLLARANRMAARFGLDTALSLRKSLHRQCLRLGPGDLQTENHAHVLSLFADDTEQIRENLQQRIYRLSRDPAELAVFVLFAIGVDWLLALQCLIPIGACWYLVERERERAGQSRKLAQSRVDGELRILSEGFRKTRLIRGYGMETREHEQFQKHLDRFRENVLQVKSGEVWSRRLCRFLIVICTSIVVYLVGARVLHPAAGFSFAGALILFVCFAGMHRPAENLLQLAGIRERIGLAADRIYRYLNLIPEVGQAVGAKFLQPLARAIAFENISYSLPNKGKLLDEFDIKIPAGGVTAFVSLDPLESLALAYLLPRFIEPQSGRVLIDGEDIAWVTLESLRAETVFVGGEDLFFTGTVLENIRCGNSELTLHTVTEAAKLTHAHNFISKLPQGYETMLGEHGEQLDPGQSFRLGLARAAVRNPALMIIAEPQERLDSDTKSLIDDAYTRLGQGRTLLFLPRRLATLKRAERIIVMHKGKVEAVGTQQVLLKTSPLYRHWEYAHFNEFRNELE